MNTTRASRLSLNGPSPPLWSQSAGRASQRVVSASDIRGDAITRSRRLVECPGRVAIVVARVAMVIPRPARNFTAQKRHGPRFRSRDGRPAVGAAQHEHPAR